MDLASTTARRSRPRCRTGGRPSRCSACGVDGQVVLGADGRPDRRIALLPASAVEILDTWHTTGLAGSGGHDYTVEDAFAPLEHTFRLGQLAAARDEEASRLASCESLDQLGPRLPLGASVHRLPDAEPGLRVVRRVAAHPPPGGLVEVDAAGSLRAFRLRRREDPNGFDDIWPWSLIAAICELRGESLVAAISDSHYDSNRRIQWETPATPAECRWMAF